MLAELVDKLFGLGRKAAHLEVLEVPGTRGTKHFVRNGETVEVVERIAKPAKTDFLDLHDFADALGNCDDPEVHIGRSSVYALIDKKDRHERISLELDETSRMRELRNLADGTSGSPRAMVRYLRKNFYGTGVGPVIQALSRVDFTRSSAGKSHIEHGRESLGRSVEASVQQADTIPESFVIRLPMIWDTLGLRSVGIEVECQVFLDVENEKIELQVPPDDLERAFTNALTEVRRLLLGELEGTDTSVYLGSES